MRTVSLQEIEELAEEKAIEIADYYEKFRQNHKSCSACRTRGFCDELKKDVEKCEAEDE